MIEIAKGAGFCFGVKRAVEKVEFLLKKGVRVCTLGELIHNGPFCERLKRKGVRVVEWIDDCGCSVGANESLVFRSHGVGPQVYDYCLRFNIDFVDATCPFVKRIHEIVSLKSKKEGKTILIAGNENHPEVRAIKEYCSGEVFVFSKFCNLWPYLKKCSKEMALVAQTTFNSFEWNAGIEKTKMLNKNIEIFNTICHVTESRQNEAVSLAKKVSLMIVVGGRASSNSRKLFELCIEFCKTLFIENVHELEIFLSKNQLPSRVGICAGASTPPDAIAMVYDLVKLALE